MTMDDELEEFGERIDGAPPPSSFVDLMQRPEAKETIGRLVDLYRGRELLPGNRDVRLDCCCPKRESCWRDAPAPKDPKNSGISIPWLGANYFDHRILVAGINFNNLGGLHMHYGVRVCGVASEVNRAERSPEEPCGDSRLWLTVSPRSLPMTTRMPQTKNWPTRGTSAPICRRSSVLREVPAPNPRLT